MRVLALDTTTRVATIAVADAGCIVAEGAGDPELSHAEQLPGSLMRVLAQARLTPACIDVFAIAAGPGSFTGLRIGIATIQGLSLVTRRPVVAVSALEALAQAAAADLPGGTRVAAWMDAHRRDVFGALYEIADAAPFTPERLVELDPPSVGAPGAMLTRWARRPPAVMVGDGAVAYAHLAARTGRVVPPKPLAGPIALMATARAARGDTIGPAGVQPIYVRRPDAEMARDEARRLERLPDDPGHVAD